VLLELTQHTFARVPRGRTAQHLPSRNSACFASIFSTIHSDLIDTQRPLRAEELSTISNILMFAALRPTRLRFVGWIAGGFAAAVAFHKAQGNRLSQSEQRESIINQLDKSCQETTGKIWFGEEESSSSTDE
jgi:hypothetical protein